MDIVIVIKFIIPFLKLCSVQVYYRENIWKLCWSMDFSLCVNTVLVATTFPSQSAAALVRLQQVYLPVLQEMLSVFHWLGYIPYVFQNSVWHTHYSCSLDIQGTSR